MSEVKVVHKWKVDDDLHFAVVKKQWDDLPPREEMEMRSYVAQSCDTLCVVDACDQWLDCGAVDRAVSDRLAALAKRVEELEGSEAYKLAGALTAQTLQENEKLERKITRLREELEQREREVVMLSAGITEEDVDDYLAQFQLREALEERLESEAFDVEAMDEAFMKCKAENKRLREELEERVRKLIAERDSITRGAVTEITRLRKAIDFVRTKVMSGYRLDPIEIGRVLNSAIRVEGRTQR